MNQVKLIGRLGADPDVKYLPDGKMVVNVNLATSNDYKKNEEWVKRPASWHRLVAFGDIAEELAKYAKGNKLEIEGKITYRQWENKDGNKMTLTEIQVWKIEGTPSDVKPSASEPVDDDIPF
ncbi:MAG: single-stranded DNA-binding protein [Dehalococcoidia bacterium]|jgi:single-strand DNA-binding protein